MLVHNFSVYDCEKLPAELLADRISNPAQPCMYKRV